MELYSFELIIEAKYSEDLADKICQALPDSFLHCYKGTVFLAVDRNAESFDAALNTAMADLKRIGIAATLGD